MCLRKDSGMLEETDVYKKKNERRRRRRRKKKKRRRRRMRNINAFCARSGCVRKFGKICNHF